MSKLKKITGWTGTIIGAPFYLLDKIVDIFVYKKLVAIYPIILVFIGISGYIDVLKNATEITALLVIGEAVLYCIGMAIIIPTVWAVEYLIAGIVAFLCVPGCLLYGICAPLRMEPSEYAKWLEKQEKYDANDGFLKKFRRKKNTEKTAAEAEAQRQREKAIYEEAYTQGFYKAKSESYQNNQYTNTQNSQTTNQSLAEYEQARVMFMLEEGFTSSELKKQYHRLLKVYHPDAGETNDEFTKKITIAYNVLKPYAR